MTTIPTIYEELNRKTVEGMLWLTEQHDSGQITDSEFYVARELAFQIVSGLAEKSVVELTFSPEPEGFKTRAEIQVLQKGDKAIVIVQRTGESESTAAYVKIEPRVVRSSKNLKSATTILKQRGWSPALTR